MTAENYMQKWTTSKYRWHKIGRAQCGVSPTSHFHVHFVDICLANFRGKLNFIGYQKLPIQLAVKGLRNCQTYRISF
jgi:hypothetical protein